jgi:hypothetical protein
MARTGRLTERVKLWEAFPLDDPSFFCVVLTCSYVRVTRRMKGLIFSAFKDLSIISSEHSIANHTTYLFLTPILILYNILCVSYIRFILPHSMLHPKSLTSRRQPPPQGSVQQAEQLLARLQRHLDRL